MIATGATKLGSVQKLYNETGWETLEVRRRKHRLVLIYKMYNNISPLYLSSLVPPLVQNTSNYRLRNADDIRTKHARTSLYSNSFLPQLFVIGTTYPALTEMQIQLISFKRHLSHGRVNVHKYFYTGNRRMQILHTRLRTGCSSLKYDLYSKNIIDSPLCDCRCGAIENTEHFFFKCHLYRDHRLVLHNSRMQHCNVSLNVIIRGNESLSDEINIRIFESVHKYIENSNRF